jgi:hypothetical protein
MRGPPFAPHSSIMSKSPRVIITSLVLGLLGACKGDAASANQEQLRREIEDARQAQITAGSAWREAMLEATEAELPPTTDAACSARPSEVEILRGRVWQALKPDELANAASGREQLRVEALTRLEQELANTHLRELEDPAPFRAKITEAAGLSDGEVDVLVVIDELTEPKETSRSGAFGSFSPGQLEGRVLVWSYAEGRIVCAGKVAATNSDEVTVGKYDNLINDLHRSALVEGLEAARATPK